MWTVKNDDSGVHDHGSPVEPQPSCPSGCPDRYVSDWDWSVRTGG